MSSRATISSMSSYAILGCGSVGHAVAEELAERNKNVLIIDRDESRVEALRDQDLDARAADIRDEEVAEYVADREVILILSSDVDANEQAVKHIRERGGDQFVVVRASDPVSSDELTQLGADVVINPSSVISDAALRALESGELEYRARQLAEVIQSTDERMAIVTHDNPDPDAIASAAALQAIADHFGVGADIVYYGDVGRQENRAFVNLLGIELTSAEETSFETYDTIALVDHAKVADSTSDLDADIYVGHFETETDHGAKFVDVRPNVSATSTILTKYIQEYDFNVGEEVATALLYGIRAATLDFRRDTLEQVESPNMSPETLDVLAEAINKREVQGSHLVSNAGFIRDRDALSQAAQQLLNLEGITTTAVFGIVDNTIHLAARSKDIRININNVLSDAFGDIGEATGYSTQATVAIPLGIFTGLETSEENRQTLLDLAAEAVTRKLFDAMGVESEKPPSNGG